MSSYILKFIASDSVVYYYIYVCIILYAYVNYVIIYLYTHINKYT